MTVTFMLAEPTRSQRHNVGGEHVVLHEGTHRGLFSFRATKKFHLRLNMPVVRIQSISYLLGDSRKTLLEKNHSQMQKSLLVFTVKQVYYLPKSKYHSARVLERLMLEH